MAAASPDPAWRAGAERAVAEAVERLLAASRAGAADIVLVAPPFASPDRPSLGLHVVAGAAEAEGVRPCVVYANLAFARVVGPRFYRALCHTPTEHLVGERLFRTAYYGTDAPGGPAPPCWETLGGGAWPAFADVQAVAARFTEAMAEALARLPAPYLGVSSVFEQTLASLSLARAVKRRDPSKCTLLGGANADGPMGEGLADFEAAVDFVFAGEAEAAVRRFLADRRAGRTDGPRVIVGLPNDDLDALPRPCFDDFFAQFDATVHEDACADGLDRLELRLPYESSRGCWWGEKRHCTFCGLNANGMTHRVKSADKVAEEIAALSEAHGVDRILMVDNIMPHGYFSTLLPKLTRTEKTLSLFYEQKANLSIERMAALKAAGVDAIQPGVESLSTALLKRMRKGSTARTNLDCLRFARSAGVHVVWNLLCDFPGDEEDDYRGMIALMPDLHHLQPPGGVGGLSIDRFSPYHNDPAAFGIRAVAPMAAYADVFEGGDLTRLAYHFAGEYDSAIRRVPGLHDELSAAVDGWISDWSAEPGPLLCLFELEPDRHLVVDTRACAVAASRLVGAGEAATLARGAATLTPEVSAALDRRQLVAVDGRYAAIACAPPASPVWAGVLAEVAA